MAEEVVEDRQPKRRKPKVKLGGQLIPILLGAVPIFLVMGLLARGGAPMHRGIFAFWVLAVGGGLAAVAYHMFYRAKVPKSVIYPPTFWKSLPIAIIIFLIGLVNMWGASANWALQLTRNQMESPGKWLQLVAKLLLRDPVEGTVEAVKFAAWVTGPNFMGGALWASIGFACIFGVGGMLAAAARREAFDPRQEPFGTAGFWPLLRAAIGFYYGWALGFGLGAVLVWGLHFFTNGITPMPPAIEALKTALGVVTDPNRAFTAAFVAGAWMLSLAMLFMGKGDFTVAFSDPKPEEKEPPMKVSIPELPKTELPNLDFGAVSAETEQIAAAFGRDLVGVIRQIGLNEEPGVVFEAPQAAESDEPGEPGFVNLLSARKPEFDTSFDEALGQLASVYVQISAQLGQMSISLAEWLTLEEGSLLEIPKAADGSVAVCINGRSVGRGKPLAHENHVAVKVVKLEPGTVEALKGS